MRPPRSPRRPSCPRGRLSHLRFLSSVRSHWLLSARAPSPGGGGSSRQRQLCAASPGPCASRTQRVREGGTPRGFPDSCPDPRSRACFSRHKPGVRWGRGVARLEAGAAAARPGLAQAPSKRQACLPGAATPLSPPQEPAAAARGPGCGASGSLWAPARPPEAPPRARPRQARCAQGRDRGQECAAQEAARDVQGQVPRAASLRADGAGASQRAAGGQAGRTGPRLRRARGDQRASSGRRGARTGGRGAAGGGARARPAGVPGPRRRSRLPGPGP